MRLASRPQACLTTIGLRLRIGVARIFCWGELCIGALNLWSGLCALCLAAFSQTQQHLNGQHSTGMQEQLQLFFSMQHSSRQSYATCHVLVQYYKISFRRQASADANSFKISSVVGVLSRCDCISTRASTLSSAIHIAVLCQCRNLLDAVLLRNLSSVSWLNLVRTDKEHVHWSH